MPKDDKPKDDKSNENKASSPAARAVTTGCSQCDSLGRKFCIHGGSGGGRSGGSGGGGKGDKQEVTSTSGKTGAAQLSSDKGHHSNELHVSARHEAHQDKMSELVSFETKDNVLTIQGKKSLSQEQWQQYVKIILAVFEEFKNELEKRGISVEGFEANHKNGILTLKIPDKELMQVFTQRLVDKHLLPEKLTQEQDHEKKQTQEKDHDKKHEHATPFRTNPFSTKPKR